MVGATGVDTMLIRDDLPELQTRNAPKMKYAAYHRQAVINSKVYGFFSYFF
jgi:hypothetical protein